MAETELTLKVDEPWLSLIASGWKTVEGRAGSAAKFEAWVGRDASLSNLMNAVRVRVEAVRHYPDLQSYIAGEGLERIAPHLDSVQAALDAYHSFYSDEHVRARGGMNALQVRVV